MEKFVADFKVLQNKRINREYYVLELESSRKLSGLKPGNFAELRVDNEPEVFLRRPISFYDVDYSRNSVRLLIREAGKGTGKLAGARKGDLINMIYPLGNSFSVPEKDRVLLIGGGVGVAPLMFLGRYLSERGIKPGFLLGFRSSDLLVDIDIFETFGPVHIASDDGSVGEEGTVMDHSVLKAPSFDRIYTCGPEVMMKAVGDYAGERDIPCEASLENTMACGFGVCLCCIQQTVHGNLRVCMEGPVFDTKDIIWQT